MKPGGSPQHHFWLLGLGCWQGQESVIMTVTAALAFLQAGNGCVELGRPRVGPFTHLTCRHCPHLSVLVSRGVLMADVKPIPGFGSLSPA